MNTGQDSVEVGYALDPDFERYLITFKGGRKSDPDLTAERKRFDAGLKLVFQAGDLWVAQLAQRVFDCLQLVIPGASELEGPPNGWLLQDRGDTPPLT